MKITKTDYSTLLVIAVLAFVAGMMIHSIAATGEPRKDFLTSEFNKGDTTSMLSTGLPASVTQ